VPLPPPIMRPFIVLALKLVPGVVRAERHGKMVNSGALQCIALRNPDAMAMEMEMLDGRKEQHHKVEHVKFLDCEKEPATGMCESFASLVQDRS
jgi:hypothetical protein